MSEKKCFKCGVTQPLTEFYPHKRMADGHLNKCKTCTRRESNERTLRLQGDPKWVVQERARHREKSRRYREEGRVAGRSSPGRVDAMKRAANVAVGNAIRDGRMKRLPCAVCGSYADAHHEDYSRPLDVVFLCDRHHADRHIHIRNQTTLGEPIMPIDEFIKRLRGAS